MSQIEVRPVRSAAERRVALRAALASHEPLVLPGASDAAGAVLVHGQRELAVRPQKTWAEAERPPASRAEPPIDRDLVEDRTQDHSAEVATVPAEPPAAPRPRHERHLLHLSMAQTDNWREDVDRLDALVEMLRSYPGEDEVSLTVVSDGERIRLDLPSIAVCCGPELRQRLAELLGERNLRVERLPS